MSISSSVKWGVYSWPHGLGVSQMLNLELLAILYLFIYTYPREIKNICPHKDLCTNVYSSITCNSQTWKQHKCPSTEWINNVNEWINKMWFIHTMEYYTVIKRKEVLTWMCNRENKHSVWLHTESISLSLIFVLCCLCLVMLALHLYKWILPIAWHL